MPVRVVDTPDFFHDQLKNSQAHVEECKRYCQPGRCVVLLVLQLGRFTDEEHGILEKLENELGWRIRESTIILFTHGEDLKGSLDQYIYANDHLRNIITMCSFRHHVFRNSCKDTKQVKGLLTKIPEYKNIFPKFNSRTFPECLTC